MKTYLALGAALLAVSACNTPAGEGNNSANAGGNASGNSAAATGSAGNAAAPATGTAQPGAAGANDTIQPGLWAMQMRMNMTAPGMPPGAGNTQQSRQECITPDEANEMANTFGEQPEGMQCSERQFTMRGGNIAGRMSCRGQGGDFTVRMSGTYTTTSFNLRQEMTGRMPGAEQPMNMQMQVEGRRVGDQCPPESQSQGRPPRGNPGASGPGGAAPGNAQ